jgi:prepilin-type N-terminal cleavage/methylation domain-containing protein
MRHWSHHRAFTLVELVLVMVVISVIAAIVVPMLNGTARGRRKGDTASQIVALARLARTQAVTEGKTYRLNIDPNGGSYWLSVRDSDAFAVLGNWSYSVPEGVRVECSLQPQQDGLYIEFKQTGRSDPATVFVRDDDGNSLQIVSESATELFHIAE